MGAESPKNELCNFAKWSSKISFAFSYKNKEGEVREL
jgi:hypothetical protein